MNTTKIQLNGQPVTLTATDRNKFDYQGAEGKIWELFDPSKSYRASLILLWACLDGDSRKRYPAPVDLADVAADGDEAVFGPLYSMCAEAGWFPTAEDLKTAIAQASAALDAESSTQD